MLINVFYCLDYLRHLFASDNRIYEVLFFVLVEAGALEKSCAVMS